jgi:hypothetical protein
MKQTPQMDKIQGQMAPGVITLDGFLGKDRRSLTDILTDDDQRVKRLGLTHADIACRMAELREAGRRGLGDFMSVPPHYEVRVDSVKGKLPCPFGHPGLFQKTYTIVRNLATDKEVMFTDLNMHMIAEHGFYEGRGGFFRLNPAELAEALEVSRPSDRGED